MSQGLISVACWPSQDRYSSKIAQLARQLLVDEVVICLMNSLLEGHAMAGC